jgi:hypothetical protein
VRLLFLALLLFACGGEPAPAPYAAPAHARVALVLEPPVVAVGEMASIELAVVTKPGFAARPLDLPRSLPGFWLIEREEPVVVKEPARWVHRTRLRVRAIEVGRFELPGGSVEVTSPEGGAERLEYEPLALEVVSTLGAHARQHSPYGVRTLPTGLAGRLTGGRGSVVAFAAGAILALASVGVLLLARRRLALRAADVVPAPESAPAWRRAREELERARASLASDPRHALDVAAVALRDYSVRRFGGDAHVRTTEELAAADPPFTMTTRWQRFVALLGELDAARFPRPPPDPEPAARLVDEVAEFVEESVPREALS